MLFGEGDTATAPALDLTNPAGAVLRMRQAARDEGELPLFELL